MDTGELVLKYYGGWYFFVDLLLYIQIFFRHSTELGRLPKVKTAATIMRRICYNNKDSLMAGLICGGWDPYEGGQIYEIPLGGTLMKQKFAIGGSGSTYIYGLVDAEYREGMTKEECKAFVKKGKIIAVISIKLTFFSFSFLKLFIASI